MSRSVNVSQGLKKFFFYLFLSGFLGLFGNHFIQKKLVQFWEPMALKLRQSGINSSAPHMVYSRHWLPVLGAHIDSVRFEKDIKCFNGVINIANVFVPFSIYQLLSQKLRIGEVEVENLKLQLIENPNCLKNGTKSDEDALVAAAEKAIEKSTSAVSTSVPPSAWFSFLDRWYTDREKVLSLNPVSSLAIRALSLEAQSLEGKELTATGKAYINFSSGVAADIQLSPLILRKKERSLSTEFSAQIHADADNLKVIGDWAFHGGHFGVDVAYSKEQNLNMALSSRDLPVGVINKWLDTAWSFQFLWLNCEVGLETKKDKLSETPWQVKSCRMNGPGGDIILANETLTSLKKPKEVSFKISKLDLDKIIYGRDHLPLSGIFNGFGQLQGLVELKDNKWKMQMELSNSQVVFSSESKRKLQTVDKINFTGGYSDSVYSLNLNSANIRNGDFEGFVAVEYDINLGSGDGRLSVQKLSFDEGIEDLMFAGEFSPLAATGFFKVDSKLRLEKAHAKLVFKDFKGSHLNINSATLNMDWFDKIFRAQFNAAQVKVFNGGAARWVIGSLLYKADEQKDFLLFTQAQAQGQITYPMQVKLESASAQTSVKSETLQLQATGLYSDRGMEGGWRWMSRENPLFQWKWRGKSQQILLIPQTARMKEWLRENADFQRENAYIYLEDKDN